MALERGHERRRKDVGRFGQPTGDEHDLRIEKRDGAGKGGREPRGDRPDRGQARLVTSTGVSDHRRTVAAAGQVPPDRVERATGGVALQPTQPLMAGVVHVGAGPAKGGGAAMKATNDPTIGEHRRTDPRADGDEDGVPGSARRTDRRFREQGEMGVVSDCYALDASEAAQIGAVEIWQIWDPAAGLFPSTNPAQ